MALSSHILFKALGIQNIFFKIFNFVNSNPIAYNVKINEQYIDSFYLSNEFQELKNWMVKKKGGRFY